MTYKDFFYNALSAITENNGGNIEKALDYCGVSSEEDRCRIKKFYERFLAYLAADDDEKFISIINSPVNLEDFANALIANDIAFSYGRTGIYVYEEDFDIAKNILKEMEENNMQEIKFTVEKILTVEDLEDIFTTAIEGGIGYWARLDNTTPEWLKAKKQIKDSGETPYWSTVAVKVLLNGDSIKFEDAEDEEDSDDWILNIEKFKKGCELYEKHRGSLIKNLHEANFDAVEADCLIQYGIFGDVIFG